jgi:hypothetical protein
MHDTLFLRQIKEGLFLVQISHVRTCSGAGQRALERTALKLDSGDGALSHGTQPSYITHFLLYCFSRKLQRNASSWSLICTVTEAENLTRCVSTRLELPTSTVYLCAYLLRSIQLLSDHATGIFQRKLMKYHPYTAMRLMRDEKAKWTATQPLAQSTGVACAHFTAWLDLLESREHCFLESHRNATPFQVTTLA